jgi:16S rRNA (cytosine1402-N4)-methyltransferase
MWKVFEVEGELPRSKTLAQAIVDIRAKKPFRVNQDFLTVIQDVYRSDKSIKFQAIYNQIFQAIRIVVNHEKDNLKKFLENYLNWLTPGGRLVIISFHSGEDRMVKEAFAKEAKDCLCPPFYPVCKCGHKKQIKILIKKPVVASSDEIKLNSRSASAKLRAIEKL